MKHSQCLNVGFSPTQLDIRRKSLEAATLERLAEAERRAEEVRAKKALLPPVCQEEETQE